VLQIHSNTNLNYNLDGQLTSQTRQQHQLHLQREDQARTNVISGHRHHQNIQARDELANSHVLPVNHPSEEAGIHV
jgi:hypothetical protein